MKHLISLLCLLTIACNNRETTNTIVFDDEDKKLTKDTTYISEVLSWRSCQEDLVKLTVNDNYPHYYLEYKKQRYPLYSYAEILSVPIVFWYDLFENRGKSCSFVLFNGSNIAEGRYSYTIFDIAPNDSLTVSGFYRINERVPANSKQTNNDTLAIMEYAKISYKATDFLSSSDKFPETKAIHYFLRKDEWTSQQKNKEEYLIMKHYEFVKE
jgi:lipoprotein